MRRGTLIAAACSDTERLSHAQTLPVFVAFRYPVPGNASIVVPVTVTNPEPSIQCQPPEACGGLHAEFDPGLAWRSRAVRAGGD